MPARQRDRGDYTGKVMDEERQKHAEELAKRQTEIGLVNEVDLVIEREGVFDPVSGELLELPPEAQAKIDQIEATVVEVEDDPILEPGQTPPLPDPSKTFQPMQPAQQTKPYVPNGMEVTDAGEAPIVQVEPSYKIMRVNTDIEDMTYGVGNTFSLKRGMRYRVSEDLYDWLESKGLVYH